MALVKLTEVCHNNILTTKQEYTLREIFVNPEHVVMIREEARMQQLNEQGLLPANLSHEHVFTKLTINRGHTGTEIVVVGSPHIVESTLNQKKEKQTLKG
jgi:hypothetical protein